MVDVDEVEPGRFLTEPDLARTGVSDFGFFPPENLGPSGFMNSDRVRHGRLMGA
jgi:hypothetical protein